MHKKVNRVWVVGFISLIGIGILLRLCRLSELFHFTYDEEVFAFVGKRMWVNHHIPLIGGVTPMHVHVAPYFYWVSGLLLGLSRLNPLGWGVAAAGIAALTMWLLFKVGQDFFGRRVAFIALILYTFSFYQNIFDRHYWGLAFDGLISLVSLWSLWQMVRGKEKFVYLLAIALAFGIHTDLSILTLFVLTILATIFFRPRVSRSTLIKAFLIFGVSFLPLIIFDLRHQFVNSRGILQYFAEVRDKKLKTVPQNSVDVVLFPAQTLARLLYPFGERDLAYQYSYCPQHVLGRIQAVPAIMSVIVLGYLGWSAFRVLRKRQGAEFQGTMLILLLIMSTYVGIFIYGFGFRSNLFDHYLATLFPPFLLLVAAGLDQAWHKWKYVTIVVLLFFGISNLQALYKANHRFGFADKERAVKWTIATTGKEDFSLDVIGDCFRYNGYRYLFYLFGKEPAKSYVDANFTHLYDRPPADVHPRTLVVLANPDFVETTEYYREYQAYREQLLTSATFGSIEVMIIDNSNLRYVGKY